MVAGIVHTEHLTMDFGAHRALDGLTLDIGQGVTGLVGANGSGKTTIFNLVLGLLTPTSGRIEVAGLDPSTQGPAVRALVGFSPERNVLPDDMAADEFVRHLAEVRGLPRPEARGRASDALWLVGLGEERFRPLGTMSTGQRQRVKLAQALASDPSIMVLDEPTDGLDPVQRDDMLALIATINREFDIDVVISSHVLEEVERVCDHVVIIDEGHLVVSGSIDELVGSSPSGVELELVDVAQPAGSIDLVMEHLAASGLTASRRDTTVSISGDEQQALDAATAACAEVGARIHRLGVRRVTLEDVYVSVDRTGSGGGSGTPGP